jgi:enediyne biosynthesis protein E4
MKNSLILLLLILGSSVAFSQTFTDIAASAGINVGDGWQGVSFVDFDNDGNDDIFSASHDGPPGVLYLNNGDGTFTDITASAGLLETSNEGGVFGDYDNDGLLDLYVSDEGPPNFLFRNNGDRTFTDVSEESGAGVSGAAISSPFGDYNNDGLLDIYVVNLGGANDLLRNNGDGTFTKVTDAAGVGNAGLGLTAVWSDFNLDGKLDLYVGNQDANVLYQNDGFGTFTDITALAGVSGGATSGVTASGDFDNDGDIDIYVASNGSDDILYQNNGDGTFTNVSATAGISNPGISVGIAFGDLDNDGWLDILVVNEGNANVLYHNNGDGTFSDISASAGIEDPAGIGQGTAFGDFDNDGDLDIFVTNINLQNRLYRNEGNANNWLNVNLVGKASNRFGIGVRVKVKSAGVWQTREVSGGSGFSSQNSIPLEFGLGTSTIVDSVVVYWSSGLISTLTQPAINGSITVTEPPLRTLDVQVDWLVSPELPITIISGSTLTVIARITNKGTADATNFKVLGLIDTNDVTIYSDTVFVSSLAGQDIMSLSFADWTPPAATVYNFTFINQLAGDEYSENDTAKVKGEVSFYKPPTVTSTTPNDSTVEVSNTFGTIRARFSEIMDSSSFDSSTVFVSGSISGPIPGEIIFRPGFNSLSIVRSSEFTYEFGETVTVTLTGEVRSILGLTLDGNENGIEEGSPTDDYTWIFIIEQPTSVGEHNNEKVTSYQLNQNYPNPFNPSTIISYSIADAQLVTLKLYNMLGEEVMTIVNQNQDTGNYSVTFDASELTSGVYIYKLSAGTFVQSKKMILLR